MDKNEQMVQDQIVARGVSNRKVLQAMLQVPREEFVPLNLRKEAFQDGPLPIGLGQTISQPYIVAFMTELLGLMPEDRVLEIGTGSGYQTAILSKMVRQVYTIEILPELLTRAKEIFLRMGYTNIEVLLGNGYHGWKEKAPFDKVILTAAPPKIPEELVIQLKEGGRMIAPVGRMFQELLVIQKSRGNITTESTIPVQFVPMVNPTEI